MDKIVGSESVREYRIERTPYATYVRTYVDGVMINEMINRSRSFDPEACISQLQALDARVKPGWVV